MANDNTRIIFLDYLRIFAFMSVLIGHKFFTHLAAFSNDLTVHSSLRSIVKLLLPLIEGGGAGVVVFFLVSGYIIAHVLQTEKTVEFIIKRIFRIYPLYIFAVLTFSISRGVQLSPPDLTIRIPQILLVGDFFNTPYALQGIEWTLRVEILFYVFMSLLRSLTFLTTQIKYLPFIFLVATGLCGWMAPIPSSDNLFKGYLTIYGPFLFLGSMFYLYENKLTNATLFLIFIALVFHQYHKLIALYQKNWAGTSFAFLAFLLFTTIWIFRQHMAAPAWIRILSDMTFSVYLFHNWLFDFIKRGLAHLPVANHYPDIEALFLLLIVCYFVMRAIEKPWIQRGRNVVKEWQFKRTTINQTNP